MDPRTGEILALANRPTFNPNRFGAYPSSRWRNRAVADAYEPGSIFKIFTAAAGLQEKVVDPDEVIDCGHGFDRGRGHPHQRPQRLRPAHLPRRDGEVERRGRGPRGPAPGPRELQPLHAATSASAPPPASSCPASRPACCARPRAGARSRLPSLSFGQEIGVTALQMTAAVARGGQRRLPDEADDRAADRGQRGARRARRRGPSRCGACSSRRTVGHAHRDPARSRGQGGTGQPRRHPRLRGGGQDGHGAEGRRERQATR